MARFRPLLPPYTAVPKGAPGATQQAARPPWTYPSVFLYIRDLMTLSSWLLIGGLLQGLALLYLGPYTLAPTALILFYRTTDHLLMAAGLTENRYLTNTISRKFSAQAPNPDGTFGSEPASESIVVFHLGARSNHPLGMFAPGVKALGDYADQMMEHMNANPVEYGLLGTSRWLKQEDAAGNEIMTVFYLRDYESLHRFAHEEVHMQGVRWWTKIVKDHPHIAIYHETYLVPKGQWENIYVNSKPTGISDTWFPVERPAGEKGAQQFVRPIVDARGAGALRSASKRLKMEGLEGREKETGDELYDMTYA